MQSQMRRKMMIGYSKQILHAFFQGQNKITPDSQWNEKVIASQSQLESDCAIKYLIGYPHGSQPSFYILCDSEELMEHTKDWLNCALPRFYCQYARPYKKAEYDFETVLLQYWSHGFLKVSMWGRDNLAIEPGMYRTFLPQAMKHSQEALDKMIGRFQSSSVVNRQPTRAVGMLVKSFMEAYNKDDHASMIENYDLIVSSEDIERRNKDTLKFMLLEAEEKWNEIIEFARQRNVSAQVISSGVSVAVMHAVISLSANNDGFSSFELDWPSMHERAIEFLPIFIKPPLFEDENQWKLWAVLAHLFKLDKEFDTAKPYVDEEWLKKLAQQDTSVNAVPMTVETRLDLTKQIHDMDSILFVLNYAQTCHEHELTSIYEWIDEAPLSMRVELKQTPVHAHLWAKLEHSALVQYRLEA